MKFSPQMQFTLTNAFGDIKDRLTKTIRSGHCTPMALTGTFNFPEGHTSKSRGEYLDATSEVMDLAPPRRDQTAPGVLPPEPLAAA